MLFIDSCSGHTSLALHDLQLSQFPPGPDTWQPVTPPAVVFSLDLAATHAPIPETARTVTRVTAGAECGEGGAECDAVLMWWDCWTDPAHSILLSCAPRHASHHAPDTELPWRDHWMQAIYYPKWVHITNYFPIYYKHIVNQQSMTLLSVSKSVIDHFRGVWRLGFQILSSL